jgi:hypothetical protein
LNPGRRGGKPATNRLSYGAAQLRRLVTGFPPLRPGFDPSSVHVKFVVDKVVLGQVFYEYFSFPCEFPFN